MVGINQLKKDFKDKNLLDLALTHRSWVNEHPGKRGTNERLEFLGDAILEYIVSSILYTQFPGKEEGYLTALRANIVNTQNLARVAESIALGKSIYLSKGEEDTGGRSNKSLLADTVEAVIGAIYLDQGLEKAREFIDINILSNIKEYINKPLKDSKSRLQELVQAQGYPAPYYKVIQETGPDHEKLFVIDAIVNSKGSGRGIGKSKSFAEQKAAENALGKLLNNKV